MCLIVHVSKTNRKYLFNAQKMPVKRNDGRKEGTHGIASLATGS